MLDYKVDGLEKGLHLSRVLFMLIGSPLVWVLQKVDAKTCISKPEICWEKFQVKKNAVGIAAVRM